MATRTRKEEWIAVGAVIGFIALGAVIFLGRNLITSRGSGAGAGSARVISTEVSPAEEEGGSGPGPTGEDSAQEDSEEKAADSSENSEGDWRGKLAQEMGLSQEQKEVLEMIGPTGEEEGPLAIDLRKRTLQEFFTEEQREKIEDRLKRYSLEGYREELREKATTQTSTSL